MIIIVFDLGPGDGGKGGVVHKLATHHLAQMVIKVGGAQGSHGVSAGEHKFAFSQWGCGTLEGIRTHLTPQIVICPEGLLNEADGLKYVGVTNAFDLLTCDERAICATPYHGIVSRLQELARGNKPRGTIGTGVGEAYRDSLVHPELAIRASDLKRNLTNILAKIREYCIEKLRPIINGEFLPQDRIAADEDIELLLDPEFLNHNVWRFKQAGSQLNVVDCDYLKRNIFDYGYNAIVESSHGVLTDSEYGFWPHVSAIRTLPSFTHKMLRDAGCVDNIATVGVHRAYTVRHGAGPIPTADPSMNDDLLPGSHKDENRWQGKIRVGPLDFVLLRYAIEVCGPIDSLAVTWFDQICLNKVWRICDRYAGISDEFFHSPHRIRTFNGEQSQLNKYQQQLCRSLFNVVPEISSIAVPDSVEEQYRLCNRVLYEKLGIPVSLVSFGPTARDKYMKE